MEIWFDCLVLHRPFKRNRIGKTQSSQKLTNMMMSHSQKSVGQLHRMIAHQHGKWKVFDTRGHQRGAAHCNTPKEDRSRIPTRCRCWTSLFCILIILVWGVPYMKTVTYRKRRKSTTTGTTCSSHVPVAAAGTPWGHQARTVIRSAPMTPAAKPPQIPSRAIGLREIKLDP